MLSKVIHLYWGRNKPLSYLRALTVLSFKHHNPDWTVRLWTPSRASSYTSWKSGEHPSLYNGTDYLEELKFEIIDFPSIGIPDELPEVHKSDLLRWYLLGTEGGIWSDMDVLYVRPITDTMRENWQGAGLCRYQAHLKSPQEFQAIGFLTSEGVWGKLFFSKLFELGLSQLHQKESYQAYGAQLLDEFLESWSERPRVPFYHNHRMMYPYFRVGEMQKYFEPGRLPNSSCFAYHWYAGNPFCAKHEANITKDNIRELAKYYSICREVVNTCLK